MLDRANAYMSHILDLPVVDHEEGVSGYASERRTRPEEGYGIPWTVAILRRRNAWWVSALPSVLSEVLPLIIPKNEGVMGFSDELIEGVVKVLASKRIYVKSHPHASCYVPSGRVECPQQTAMIRKITEADDVSRFGYGVPAESVEFGSAFGAFDRNEPIGFVEATPLPTVTEKFGVMLVGIEVNGQFRRQGLGHSLLATLTNNVLNLGKLPWYQCSISNHASQRTALSCGYVEYGQLLRFQA